MSGPIRYAWIVSRKRTVQFSLYKHLNYKMPSVTSEM